MPNASSSTAEWVAAFAERFAEKAMELGRTVARTDEDTAASVAIAWCIAGQMMALAAERLQDVPGGAALLAVAVRQ